MPYQYRRKPRLVDAMHYEGNDADARRPILDWLTGLGFSMELITTPNIHGSFYLQMARAAEEVAPGDWVVHAGANRLRVYPPDSFAEEFDLVGEA